MLNNQNIFLRIAFSICNRIGHNGPYAFNNFSRGTPPLQPKPRFGFIFKSGNFPLENQYTADSAVLTVFETLKNIDFH